MTNTNVRLMADESIGGIQREYILEDVEINVAGFRDPKHKATLVPTDIVVIDGTRYQIAKREAEVGENVLVVKADVAIGAYEDGEVFEVIEFQREVGDGAVYVNRKFHDGSQVFLNLPEYRVLIPIDSEQAESTPDIHDLLANLAQRVTSLERITGELVRAKSSLESQLNDAMRNTERLAQDLEREKDFRASIYVKVSDLKDEVEANTKDIKFLDDRTFEKPGKPTKSAEEILREISKILERDERQ